MSRRQGRRHVQEALRAVDRPAARSWPTSVDRPRRSPLSPPEQAQPAQRARQPRRPVRRLRRGRRSSPCPARRLADRLQNQFARQGRGEELFPDVITLALQNTVIYTLSGFVFGLVLGMVIALMRLSSVAPYRWVATRLHRDLPRPARPADLHLRRRRPCRWRSRVRRSPAASYGKVALAPRAGRRRLHGRDDPRGHPGGAQGADGGGPFAGLLARPGACSRSIIPQAFRIVIPPLTNELVLLFKDSSLVLFLGVTLASVS